MPVFINNADDYLGPSQACVNPLFTAPTSAAPVKSKDEEPSLEGIGKGVTSKSSNDDIVPSTGAAALRRRKQPRRFHRIAYEDKKAQSNNHDSKTVRLTNSPADKSSSNNKKSVSSETYTISTKKKATVTLSDCLACSGCVTSAEAVLMEHHSIEKLKEFCTQQIQSEKQKKIVFTISPASLSDLYRHLYLEGKENSDSLELPSRQWLLSKVAAFLHKEFGAEMVIDGTLPQTISLLESASEFCYRYREYMKRDESLEVETSQQLPSIALSSTQTRFIDKQSIAMNMDDDDTLTEVTTITHLPGLIIEGDDKTRAKSTTPKASLLPLLCSSCPGFVCLVEKTASAAVPLLSSAKSPMAVAGTLIKSGICDIGKGTTNDLFHVAIMPCHDKKLEAGRGDFSWEQQTLLNYGNAFKNSEASLSESNGKAMTEEHMKEVDMVLTTAELLEVLTATDEIASNTTNDGPTVDSIRCKLNELKDATADDVELLQSRADNIVTEDLEVDLNIELYGSGSYADYIFRHAAWEMFKCRLKPDEALPWADSSNTTNNDASNASKAGGVIRRRRKRPDVSGLREVSLYKHPDGTYSCVKPKDVPAKVALKFATAYGFKNVQTVLQSLSKKTGSLDKRTDYHYIEIMACPSGCPNGGGQIGANGRRETPRETKERVKKVAQTVPRVIMQDQHIPSYYGSNEPFSQSARRLFHTRNHVVPELELSTGASAGVAVNATKW